MASPAETALASTLARHADAVARFLDGAMTPALLEGEIARPQRLVDAMRHAVLNGGKRMRPFLVMEAALLFGLPAEASIRAAAAIECIHCYSLVHDDLPAMDDDDLRRGQPTVHKAFDEATAILAGDSLLTFAFDLLADPATHDDPQRRCELVLLYARAAGLGGMAGGQMMDLESEGRERQAGEIATLQAMKTGALIRASCEAGAVLAGAGNADRMRLRRFGEHVGRAFQLADDILDITSSAEDLGKATGKDGGRGKATLASLLGVDKSREIATGEIRQAEALLEPYGERAAMLCACARFAVERGH